DLEPATQRCDDRSELLDFRCRASPHRLQGSLGCIMCCLETVAHFMDGCLQCGDLPCRRALRTLHCSVRLGLLMLELVAEGADRCLEVHVCRPNRRRVRWLGGLRGASSPGLVPQSLVHTVHAAEQPLAPFVPG